MIDTENVITEALVEATETMAFLTMIPLEEEFVIPEKTVLAEMGFKGPKSGLIQILADIDFCRILAENIGALSEADDKACYDAIGELVNVVCGLVLPSMASSRTDVFEVTVPAIQTNGNSLSWDEFIQRQNCFISNIEGYAVASRLIVNN
jgi:CheY-specific phosphatase CheX